MSWRGVIIPVIYYPDAGGNGVNHSGYLLSRRGGNEVENVFNQ